MNGFNRAILVGRLTDDPTSKMIPSGVPVTEMRLAVSETYKNKEGEFAERSCFIDVVVWRRQAETCAQYLRKGSPILVEGQIQYDVWTGQDGQKRSKYRIKADRVQFLSTGPKPDKTSTPEPAGAGAPDDNDPF